MTQATDDDFEWTWRDAPTDSGNTGPSSGFGGTGGYMYIETSSIADGDIARYISLNSHQSIPIFSI